MAVKASTFGAQLYLPVGAVISTTTLNDDKQQPANG
jgi:hypothetical protein